ncbi:glycosyltransferase [Xanthocytophaga agilis]|uniref:Glycosyltransferase n=1 Tax=Xanthocytophaga agilis TaxID=3048010 RepID=A0AAE3R732_9BACT|nr:glycosyltransferase [Xanthocytophaga agilis]MDJ1502654.1 glycosyltransferase [Xanthocytophaga agilis]
MKKVSICMITYNHAKYIAQAIESVLMQETTFDYELVIGDDCSTDNTREIIQIYKNKHPDKIRLLLPDNNLGMMRNFTTTLSSCTGDFIALLDGDDYWTCSQKLQKQINFLEANTDYSICFHKVVLHYESREHLNYESNKDQSETSSYKDLCLENYISTPSIVFSRKNITKLPDWLINAKVGDWTLSLYVAQFGKIKFFNEAMGVYRYHNGGVWSTLTYIEQTQKLINIYDFLKKNLPSHYIPFLDKGKKKARQHLFSLVKPDLVQEKETAIINGKVVYAVKMLLKYYHYNTEPIQTKGPFFIQELSRILLVGGLRFLKKQ